MTPLLWLYRPVSQAARDGQHSGNGMYDVVKLVPRAVIRLRRFGMAGRSATRMSSVEMKTMLGRPSATATVAAVVGCGRDISAAGVASARAAIRHESHRARTLRRPTDRFPASGLEPVP